MGGRAHGAAGVMLATAAGDALGAGYEGQPPARGAISMIGGGYGGFAPGEWTDDTDMAVCIAEVAATGSTDTSAIGEGFLAWLRGGPADVGIATREVLATAAAGHDLPAAARAYFAEHPRGAAGNGALMRTAPVALAHLGDDAALARHARAVAELTHADPLAGDSCVLWCVAIDRALREGRLDGVHDGLALLPQERRAEWVAAIAEAEQHPPERFGRNGFTVTALQAAYAAIVHTPVPEDRPARHLVDALKRAVRIGHDTDTVAAIAGGLLGARWGASAIPFAWRRRLHGCNPSEPRRPYRAADLVRLAVLTAEHGATPEDAWPRAPRLGGTGDEPYIASLPGDPEVLLGDRASLSRAHDEREVDAVVSLCQVGTAEVHDDLEHHEVWLVDKGAEANPNLDTVLDDAVEALRTLRAEGKRVYLHCAGGRSRTPTVAAAYLAEVSGCSPREAWDMVAERLPSPDAWNTALQAALARRQPRER